MAQPGMVMECLLTDVNPENDLRNVVGQHVVLAFQSCIDGSLFAKLLNDAKSLLPMPITRRRMKVAVSHASGSTIWIQQAQQADLLSNLLDEMFEAHEEGSEPLASTVVGTLCAAKSLEDDNWYRAEIEDVSTECVVVRYLDYGNTESLQIGNLKILSKKLSEIHALAAKVSLPIVTEDLNLGETILEMSSEKVFTAVFVKEQKGWLAELLDGKQEFSKALILTGRALSMKDSPFPALLAQPDRETSSLTVNTSTRATVSFALSTSEFYIQEEKDQSKLYQLQEDIQSLSHCMKPLTALEVGSMCLALYAEDSVWYRGMVLANKKIFFVDFGNSEEVDSENIKSLPPALQQIKHFAVKCCLRVPEGKLWSRNSSERLAELIVEPEEPVVVTAVAKLDDIIVVDLSTATGNVADTLAAEGYLEDLEVSCNSNLRVFVTSVASPSDFWVSCPNPSESDMNMHCSLYLPSNVSDWSQAAISHFKDLVANGTVLFDLETLISGDVSVVSLTLNGKKIDQELVALCNQVLVKDAPSLQAEVVFANKPSDFYIHLLRDSDVVQEMADNLENAESFAACDDTSSGAICAALFSDDDLWYRAKIIGKQSDGFQVLFIDYGNTSIVTELRSLPQQLQKMPPLALHCCLPLPDKFAWSDAAAQKFEEITNLSEAVFEVELLSCEEPFVTCLTLAGVNIAFDLAKVSDIDVSTINDFIDTLRSSMQSAISKGSSVPVDDSVMQSDIVEAKHLSQSTVAANVSGNLTCMEADSSSIISGILEHSDGTGGDSITFDGDLLVDHPCSQETLLGSQETCCFSNMDEVSGSIEDSIIEVDCSTKDIPLITIDDSVDEHTDIIHEVLETVLEHTLPVIETTEEVSFGANVDVCELDVSETLTNSASDTEIPIPSGYVEFKPECSGALIEKYGSDEQDCACESNILFSALDVSKIRNDIDSTVTDIETEVHTSGSSAMKIPEYPEMLVKEPSGDHLGLEAMSTEQDTPTCKDEPIETECHNDSVHVNFSTYPNSISCELDIDGVCKGQFVARASDFQSEFQHGIPGTLIYRFEDCEHSHTIDVSSCILDAEASH